MDTDLERYDRHAGSGQSGACNSGQLGIAGLHLSEWSLSRASNGPDWTALPEGIFLHISRCLDPHTVSNARAVCRPWRRAFSLNVHTARLEIGEHRAAQARAFMRAFVRAFPYTTELVLEITFRRTAREKIQTALEEHVLALQDFGLQVLQLNLDLNSFNERKIKLLDVSLLASWASLTRLVLQESGWRSQQLRVDAPTVFSSLPALQELSVVCKYSGQVKAKWWRPPPPSSHHHKAPTSLGRERRATVAAAGSAGLPGRIPTWPPAAAAAAAATAGSGRVFCGGSISNSSMGSTNSVGISGGGGGSGSATMLPLEPYGLAAGGVPMADQQSSNQTGGWPAAAAGGGGPGGLLWEQRQLPQILPTPPPLQQQQQHQQQSLELAAGVISGTGGDAAMEDANAASVYSMKRLPAPSAPRTCRSQGLGEAQPMVGPTAAASAAVAAVAAAGALSECDVVGGGGVLVPPTLAPPLLGAGGVVSPLVVAVRPLVTQHLRCQLTQNQSMSGELQKALKRITPALQQHVSALTFEIVEETYPEPSRCATPLELSALPGLKSVTVLSGAEDALSHSKLDLVGATGLEALVLFDVSCGCWCYKKPGHGIPPRLLSAPPAYLRSLTVVGFVVNQCQNLHALSSLTCLEELRLEQPDPDCLAAVTGELLLTWLPSSLRRLKLHSVVLPPCGVPSSVAAEAAPAGSEALVPPPGPGWFGGAGWGMDAATAAAAAGAGGDSSSNAAQLVCGVAPVAPLPQLRELYLSKCKVPTLGLLGGCSHLTALGVINCLSSSGMMPAAAAMPALRFLAVIYTLPPEQEYIGSGGAVGPGVVLSGMMPSPAFTAAAAGSIHFGAAAPSTTTAAPRTAAATAGGGTATAIPITTAPDFGGGGIDLDWSAAAAAAMPTAMPPPQHVLGLPLPPVVWGSDKQVAAVAGCRTVTSLEVILPRGTAGAAAVASLASLKDLVELDVALPCGLSCCMMGLARLGRSSGGRLRRLTLWVDSRTCVNREKARQLQALQRSLQTRMPDTLVEWAGAESRQGSWTGLEARVFNPH